MKFIVPRAENKVPLFTLNIFTWFISIFILWNVFVISLMLISKEETHQIFEKFLCLAFAQNRLVNKKSHLVVLFNKNKYRLTSL